jgi:quinol monooxygenase YgiN
MKYVVTVRGTLKSTDPKQARIDHDTTFERLGAIGKSLGSIGHQTFLDPQNPRQFLAIDTWPSMEALQQFMGHAINPGAAIAAMFEGQPDVTVWGESGWNGF